MSLSRFNQGFTLVELSIVLIIIGLITSGVLAGKSLIEAAEVRAQVRQLEEIKTAYYTFQLKYDAIPGDMPDAVASGLGATDGDGDGMVSGRASSANTLGDEQIVFFEHLSSAKLIKGVYTHVFELDNGFPSLKINDTNGMVAGSSATLSGSAATRQLSAETASKERTAVIYMNVNDDAGGWGFDDFVGTMTVQQSMIVDTKIDDGSANSGQFIGHRTALSTEGDCLDGIDGEYLSTSPDNQACNPWYVIEK